MNRLKSWLVTLFLLVAIVAVVVDSVYLQHRTRQTFAGLQVLNKQVRELNKEWGRLQSEYSTKVDNGLIERFARQELGMKKPQDDQIITIKR